MNCNATTKSGLPCRAAAGPSGLCFLHANPGQAKKLGQAGGLKNRRPLPVDICVPQNLTIADLSTINAQAMRYVLSGDLEPGAARALVQMSGLQMRILEGAHYEERLTLVENQIASLRARPSSELPVKEEAGMPEVSETSDEVDEHGASSKLNESEKKASAVTEQAKEESEEGVSTEIESDQASDPSDADQS